MTTATRNMDVEEAVERARSGHKSEILCPAHNDSSPSLSVGPGTEQPVTLHCHANCTTEAILEAAGLEWADVCAPFDDAEVDGELWTPAGNASHIYPYRRADGTVEFEVLRVPQSNGKKTFLQRHMDPETRRWAWNITGLDRMLYRLPEVKAAVAAGETIYITEGEKDVHSLLRRHLNATCNPGGAGKWKDEYAADLAGANVVICSDADSVGRAHARMVRESLEKVGCTITVLEPADGAKDVTAHFIAGGTMDTMLVVRPSDSSDREKFGVDVLDVIVRSISSVEFVWPGTMARRERLIVTGFEGMGKSTLLRQIGVQLAAGIRPWTVCQPIPPQTVLVIDAENEPGQTLESWQQMVGIAAHYERPVERGRLIILEEWDASDLDLAGPDGSDWLHERINAYRPDIVVMGPLTNLVGRDLKDDEPVRRLKRAVNSARTICGSAFIMEHHAPHKGPMDRDRPVRPYGSSMFLKWPDYGYGLKPTEAEGTYDWQRTRWPRVRSRIWPEQLRNGNTNLGEWPWMETVTV